MREGPALANSAVPRTSAITPATIVVAEMPRIPINIAELVGGTPLVGLPRMLDGTPAADNGVELFAKLEAFNPGGSVKDRIGVAMIEAAEAQGSIEPGRTTIVEATSGNTGIALAFVCAAKGYELVLTLPQGMSRERESLLRLYGARVEITESLGGMGEAVAAARAMARARRRVPARSVLEPRQPRGAPAHDRPRDRARARRARRRAGGRAWAPAARSRESASTCASTQPAAARRGRRAARLGGALGSAPGPHRIQGIGAGFVPPVLNRELLDEVIAVSDDDAIQTAWSCARRCGLLAGISCGAALWAALEVAARPESGGLRIVVIMPDSGERYVSQAFFAP